MLITPAKYEDEMLKIQDWTSNPDTLYQASLDLMCEVLESMGYEAGVAIFKEIKKRCI